MSAEETLIQTRKEKHQEANRGKFLLAVDPGVLPFVRHHPIESALSLMTRKQEDGTLITSIDRRELEQEPRYMLRGRISAFRKSGGITFIKLTDSTGSVQLIVSKNVFDNYDWLKNLDLGDIIEAGGWTCLSKTGEKSILVWGMRLLTK